jgi:sigma-E factor negative regulatory protein RseA
MSRHQDPEIVEQLSALVDGELDAERSRFLIRRLASDPELMAAWERMHLLRSCLRREGGALAGRGLSAAVTTAIADERAHSRAAVPLVRMGRWAAGGAIAASVALAALLVAQPTVAPEAGRSSVASVPATGPDGQARVAPSTLRERDLRPALAAQTASAARHPAPMAGAPAPLHVAQPLYLPSYLAQPGSREFVLVPRVDASGRSWVLIEETTAGDVRQRSSDQP